MCLLLINHHNTKSVFVFNSLKSMGLFCRSYNVTLNIGQPPKPYFLDPDTGSDLTWLQCDAPCVRCTEVINDKSQLHIVLTFLVRMPKLLLVTVLWASGLELMLASS